MIKYFHEPYEHSGGDIKVELNLPSYATKENLKGTVGVATSNLAIKSDLTSLKAEVDE